MNQFLTTHQAAEILRYHPISVNRAILDGNLIASKFGRDWFIRPEDLRTFVITHPRPSRLAHIDVSKLNAYMIEGLKAGEKLVPRNVENILPEGWTLGEVQK